MSLPLLGVKVLEIGDFLPTAFCCMQLGDFGAEVIRIQAPAKANKGRRAEQGAKVPAETRSPFQTEPVFDSTGRNRKSISLNLKDSGGQKIAKELAAQCDVVVEGFRPGVMKRLGIDYESLSRHHPKLVYCSVTLFGQNGPYRDWPGHDPMGLGVAGLFHLNSNPDDNIPKLLGTPIGDVTAGLHASIGILLALRSKDTTGVGQYIDISMTDSSLDFSILSSVQALQKTTVPRLNRPNPISGIWKTSDGKYICTTNIEPHHWANFCKSIGHESFIELRYDRSKREELFKTVGEKILTRTQQEWLSIFHGELESQAAPVNTINEVFSDPQVLARNMVINCSDQNGKSGQQLGFSIKLEKTPAQLRTIAPLPGADTSQILKNLGYKDAAIEELINSAAING